MDGEYEANGDFGLKTPGNQRDEMTAVRNLVVIREGKGQGHVFLTGMPRSQVEWKSPTLKRVVKHRVMCGNTGCAIRLRPSAVHMGHDVQGNEGHRVDPIVTYGRTSVLHARVLVGCGIMGCERWIAERIG